MEPTGYEVRAALAALFEVREVKWKPQSVKGNRAMAMAYIDARLVMDRLDAVLGVENWQDSYDIQPDGSVVCRLALRLGGEWVTKTDVGSPSEQPDGGDRLKAAFSDALKRAAVKFGVGRYLYRLPAVWADYDAQKRQFVTTPALPLWAVPKDDRATPGGGAGAAAPAPVGGEALHGRIRQKDAKLAAAGRAKAGELVAHLAQAGLKAGYGDDLEKWPAAAFAFAVETVKKFEAAHPPGGGSAA